VARERKGQALVELAIIFPLLLVLLLGMVEVGDLMRDVLELQNRNRELARFAARGTWPETVLGYIPALFQDEKECVVVWLRYFDLSQKGGVASLKDSSKYVHGEEYGIQFDDIDIGPFLASEQEIIDAELGVSAPTKIVVVDTSILHYPVVGFFGVNPMRIHAQAVFRVSPGRRLN